MRLDPTISYGTLLTGISFLVAVIVFVVSMRPRIDGLERSQKSIVDWQRAHEEHAFARDEAIRDLAVKMGTLTATHTVVRDWQDTQERQSLARDEAIRDLAVQMGTLSANHGGAEGRVERLEKLFGLFLAKLLGVKEME